ncbi:hypothetical protein PQ460_05430 [Paenibacillus sp. KACC 21273]|uniref:hypothetical protein n=1 Tax=Paenibacillus sp. KACC 21273 TaxID=3025665 RepID=UPI0023665C35|nr:hypothetical protein [Paenibacillus sp. KACC 21273]WDF51877.1 hypothetical protein PQ460_05430 [Paenibacillus sp. KACC 21273]
MINLLRENFDDRKQKKYLNISVLIMMLSLFTVSYLNRHLGVLSYFWGVIIAGASFIPGILVIIAIYILADEPERKQYRIRLYLGVIVFSIIGYLRYGT